MKLTEFLQRIRTASGLQNAIVYGITLHTKQRVAEFSIVTDKTYVEAEVERAKVIAQEYLPEGWSAEIKMIKRVPDAAALKQRIFDYIATKFPAVSAFLNFEHIQVEMLESGAHFVVDIASGEQQLFSSGKILDDVSAYLQSYYCGTFYGNVRIVEKEPLGEDLLNELPETEDVPVCEIRRFPIWEFSTIDGVDEKPRTAVYIADLHLVEGPFSLCGKITFINEIQYVKRNDKTGEDMQKSRFSISLSDGTGDARFTYFPKKATLEKIRGLHVGDSIVVTGENELYNGNLSFKASRINRGEQPDNFTPVAKKGKPVPKFYHTVFPEEYVDYMQTDLFASFDKPADLTDNVFVVFDLETTGLNNSPAMGKVDRIIEVGAVKIIGGEIKERFSTFVACPERLSGEIIRLTGITDEDLVGAPNIEDVIADFYKFVDGAILVGHNVTFDARFIQYYGEENGFYFGHRQLDTLTLAQELLRGQLPNYKLNSVADHFGFTFNHHRAFDDACVTAKVFIEFIKQRKMLPN